MTVFIQKGDAPLSARQATKRGMAFVASELALAGGRKGDEELLRVIPHENLPPRLAAVVHALGYVSYEAVALGWEADNAINQTNNMFNHQLVAYRAAQARLAQYRLADGRPEVTGEQRATDDQGVPVFDEATGDPVMETIVAQTAIDPIPAQVEQAVFDETTGEQIGAEMVANPAIARDDAERAQAQAVIDGMPVEVSAHAAAEEAAGP
jgi:hypothetical protein